MFFQCEKDTKYKTCMNHDMKLKLEFHVVVHASLVFGILFALEEHHDSSPLFSPGAFFENSFWDRISEGSAGTAVLDVLFLEPLVWELSPFSTFNGLDHSADIEVFVLVNDVEFLKYAGCVSELSLPFFSFLLQFISQTVSKLEEIVGGALVSVHGFHHVLEKFVLILVVFLAVFHASHVSEWGFVSLFVLEHLFHHHLHKHFLHHVILRSLLLTKDKLDWGVLALLVVLLSTEYGHGFEHFHCFEIFGTFE